MKVKVEDESKRAFDASAWHEATTPIANVEDSGRVPQEGFKSN